MRYRAIALSAATVMLLPVAGQLSATAAVKPPITVASGLSQETPQVLVTNKGTILMTHIASTKPDQSGERYPIVRIARKPKSAKKFALIKMPNETTNEEPFLFQPSKGVIELLVTLNGPLTVAGWKSTDDGKKWSKIDASAVNDPSLRSNGIYINTSLLADAPGGPVQYAGDTGESGPVVQISSDLKHVKQIATNSQASYVDTIGETSNGIVFQVGTDLDASSSSYPYEVDHAAGSVIKKGGVTFPKASCGTGDLGDFALAVGKSNAVVVHSACGHVWSRSLSLRGAVGKLVKLGAGDERYPTVDVVADRHHHYTASFSTTGDDIGIARSKNGTKWKKAKGALPVTAPGSYGTTGHLSRGTASWLGYGIHAKGPNRYHLNAIPLSDSYRSPRPPHGSGRHLRFGSFAATTPKKIKARSFRPHGRASVKIVDQLAGKVTVSIGVERVRKTSTLDLCSGLKNVHAKPGRAVTVHLVCAGSGVVIGGTASPRVPVKRGDDVTFQFISRNGAVTAPAKIH